MKLLIGFIVFLTMSFASAAELIEISQSVRALGMGNAFTAVVKDKDSLYYNPAGLGRVDKIAWTIINIPAGADGADVIEQVQNAQEDSGYAAMLRDFFGKKLWVGLGADTAITLPYFAASLYDSGFISAYLENPAYPNMNVTFINDYGMAIGAAMPILPGMNIGVVGKRIMRTGASVPVGLDILATLSSEDLVDQLNNTGTGHSLDLGLTFTMPTPVEPTFSLVWKNIGYTTFLNPAGTQAPPMMVDEKIFGFSATFDATVVSITPAIDFKYMLRNEVQLGKKLHIGVEVDMPMLAMRAGFHQGYYTLGVGADLGLFKIDAATYGVELGEYPGQHEDRRYVVSMKLELGFDSSLGFLGGGNGAGSSGRRGLKRRR
jgi:hypothetical protein